MPNWTDLSTPPDNIIDLDEWRKVVNNLKALNNIVGHPNGGHVSLEDGGPLLGNGEGAIQAMSPVPAKGSLIVGDGATDPTVRTVGNNDELLKGGSGEAPGLIYEEINWKQAEFALYG